MKWIDRAALGEGSLWFSPLTLANVHDLYQKHAGAAKAMVAIQTLA